MPEPLKPYALERPPFDSTLVALNPIIAPALKKSIDDLVVSDTKKQTPNSSKYGTESTMGNETSVK